MSTIENLHLEHIKNQLEQGNIILFTGSGFSLSAKNKNGTYLPSGPQLAKDIWKTVRPEKAFDDATLEDVYSAALKISRNKTTQLLRNVLNVDPSSLPDWYRVYLNQPWNKIYTLNVDNFWHAAFLHFGFDRGYSIYSATTSKVVTEKGNTPLNIVHLNGSYDDIPDGIVFSVDQYAQRLKEFDRFYLDFSAAFSTKTVLFVGTPIDESPFWKHIQLRKSKSQEEGHRELRPRSYIICPTLTEARKSLLGEYNIVHIPMTAEQFSTSLESLKESSLKGLNKIHTEYTNLNKASQISLVSDLVSQISSISSSIEPDFLLGAEPQWKDIVEEKAIPRTIEKELYNSIDQLIKVEKRSLNRVILLTGTAGDGKSTFAMRTAVQLSSSGKRVVWLDANTRIRTSDIPEKLKELDAIDVCFIDNADSFGRTLSQTLSECLKNLYVKAIIVITRSSKADKVLIKEELLPFSWQEISSMRLDDSEIDSLIKVLEKYNRLGALLKKPIDLQRKAFKDRADRQLIVALIEATSGKSFDEKIVNEYEDLDDKSRFVYLLLALASHFRASISKDDILVLDSVKSAHVLNSIDMLLKRGLIFQKENGGLILRHRMISDCIVDDLNQKGLTEELFKDLGFIAGVKYSSHENIGLRKSPYKDLLIRCVNHETLHRMLNYDAAQRVYACLEDILKGNYHYWLQRGCLELERGNLSSARLFLNHAKSLNENDDFVEATEAHLDFKVAWSNPTSKDAHSIAGKAIGRLENLIANKGKYNPYPFHILGSQGLQWTRRAPLQPQEKINYLEKFRKIVDEGIRLHQGDRSLSDLSEQIRKEYLMVAVK